MFNWIKGGFALDDFITIWGSLEWARETIQKVLFFNVNFDKAYDRNKIEWDFVLKCWIFSGIVQTLFSIVL